MTATLTQPSLASLPQPPVRMCTRCIMDTTDPAITFDSAGVCNHCHRYDELAATRIFSHRPGALESLVAAIKRDGHGRRYDCVIGVSGGVDSSYVAYLVKQLGLRPLAVHLDNGWDHELAVANIEKLLKRLDIDLYTHVIDWLEFRDLQLAFLKASTPDGEIPTDHAIFALLYQMAAREGLRWILPGTNVVTEATLPQAWSYGYFDCKYISAVQRRFGTRKLSTYPRMRLAQLGYHTAVRRIRMVSILNYVEYDKRSVMELLQRDLDWTSYGDKHHESIYTRFFQAYILPQKFNIDKRKAHYSTLICSGQMTRARALEQMQQPPYSPEQAASDREYAIKKFGITEAEFDRIMALPPRSYRDYPNQAALMERVKRLHSLRSWALGRSIR
jgi:N-acetyl sugar amidotransferase